MDVLQQECSKKNVKRGSGFKRFPVSNLNLGGDLLSHRVSPAVPSALVSLTSEFGMGSGVTSLLWPPRNLISFLDMNM